MRETIFLILTLAILWLAISGVYKPAIMLLGLGSLILVSWLVIRMKIIGEEHNPIVFSWRLPVFWLWALREIVISNVHVARLIFSPEKISPRIVYQAIEFERPLGKVIYGNTCTLTPGTVTVQLTRKGSVIHALDAKSAGSLAQLIEKVEWLEGRQAKTPEAQA
ncbi:MAG: Na+/H+ antiporter subunit E [Wenzhouxiangella sp.]